MKKILILLSIILGVIIVTAAVFSLSSKSPLAKAIFIANQNDNSISIVDAQSLKEVSRIHGNFSEPHNIQLSPDGNTLWVTNGGNNTVSVLDAHTLQHLATIQVGHHPAHVVLTPDSKKAIVTNSGDNNITIIDAQSYRVISTISVGKFPHGLRLDSSGAIAYVADYKDGALDIMDIHKGQRVAQVALGGKAAVQVAPVEKRNEVYIALGDLKTVAVVDTKEHKFIKEISVTYNPAQLYALPDQQYVLVAEQGTQKAPGNIVSFINTETKVVDFKVTVGKGPHGLYVDPSGKNAYVTNMYENTVSQIDLDTKKVKTVEVGDLPNGITGIGNNVQIPEKQIMPPPKRTEMEMNEHEDKTVTELPKAKVSEVVELKNGDSYDLTAEYVNQEINGENYKMFAYNGSIPGPIFKVPQGSTITINFTNNTDIPTSIHSHGVRLEDAFDGVVDAQHPAVEPGKRFTYTIKFPDAGMFWYHPHLHEPYTQSHGFYGAYWVVPSDKNYWYPVNEEIPLMLNDMFIQNGQTRDFNPKVTNYALMGEFGNVMLVNGLTDYQKDFQLGEVVRFYLVNASNTRVYNLSIPGAKIKLVGGDNGKYERETWQDYIILSPSERAVIEVLFDKPGAYTLQNTNPYHTYDLATFTVSDAKVSQNFVKGFAVLHENKDVMADIDAFRDAFDKKPDKSITLTMQMGGMENMQGMDGMGGMHDMENMQGMDGMGGMHDTDGIHMTPQRSHIMPNGAMMSNDAIIDENGENQKENVQENSGIEWEDSMPMMNAMSTTNTVQWKMVDNETQKENEQIDWKFKVGDQVKIKIFNDPNSMHPMQHPIHFHGQRFLVLSTNGVKNTNLVWKDTVLVPAGDTIEVLVDMSNPGQWMMHCHISEHLESGMMLPFEVR